MKVEERERDKLENKVNGKEREMRKKIKFG